MKFAWWLNVVGTALNIIAAVLMYYFPPRVRLFTNQGEQIISWISNASEQNKLVGQWQLWLSKFAPALMALGFVLQLLAACLSA